LEGRQRDKKEAKTLIIKAFWLLNLVPAVGLEGTHGYKT